MDFGFTRFMSMTIDRHIFKSQTQTINKSLKKVKFIRRIFKPSQIYKLSGKNCQLLSKNVIIILFESDI